MEEYKKSVNWIITDPEFGSVYDQFQLLSIYKGRNQFDLLQKIVNDFVEKNLPGKVLLREPQLMETLEAVKLPITRSTLNKWRRTGILIKKKHWFTDGTSVVYDYVKTVEVIRERENAREAHTS